MLSRARLISRCKVRRLSSSIHHSPEDEGDWIYSSEWWGADSDGHTVFESNSDMGNGIVSVVAYPSSRPIAAQWSAMEGRLQKRYTKVHPECEHNEQFRVLGYQWRVLRFNGVTRQSTAKVMAAYMKSDPNFIYFMQQPHCLAVPYLKSMMSAGLATLACGNYDLLSAIHGKKPLHILCIGHGGGSLPLFLASKIQGAIVHVVDIDPVVISASIQAMGFPAAALKKTAEPTQPTLADQILWEGIHERIFLYESDAESFIRSGSNVYDAVFIDAYDGADIFPWKLWDPHGPFLETLRSRLHPVHGTVVVNLHADSDVSSEDGNVSPLLYHILPMGKYVSKVGKAYKGVLLKREDSGVAFSVSVPWLCNISLVVGRGTGFGGDKHMILNALSSKASIVEDALKLPFSCLQYIRRGFALVD